MDSNESYLIDNLFNLFARFFFSALKERTDAVLKDIAHVREQLQQSENEKEEFHCKVNDQNLEISSLKTSLEEQTKVSTALGRIKRQSDTCKWDM